MRSHKSRHNFIDTLLTYISQRTTLKTSVNDNDNNRILVVEVIVIVIAFYITLVYIYIHILLQYNLIHLENQLQFYLYGHVSINYVGNRNILISTVKCIKKTPRFSTLSIGVGFGVGGRDGVRACYLLSLSVLFFVLFVCMCLLYSTILFLLKYSVVNF